MEDRLLKNEGWVGIAEVARHLNIKEQTLYKWLERKVIPAHKVGRLWRFKTSEVDAWVRSGEAKSPTPPKLKASNGVKSGD